MEAAREAFWHIEYGWLIYLLGLLLLPLIGYTIYRRRRLWQIGKPEGRFEKGRIKAFVTGTIDILLHKRLLGIGAMPLSIGELYAGVMHLLIFGGILLLLLVT
ncbi:MAG: hypothetical protein CO171_01165, partial [Syntrophobacterales bacterium CG_4_9_14_3_um_filter_49_8]